MNRAPRAYWREQREDRMRRARVARWYATTPDLSAKARELWTQTARDMVTEARAHNRELIRAH